MKLRELNILERLTEPYDEFETYPEDVDAAYNIAKSQGIRISSNKEIKFIAKNGSKVVGAVWASVYPDDSYDQEIYIYDFDIATDRRTPGVFLQLMDDVLRDFRDISALYDEPTIIRSWVVNPRLADVLERKYGFEVESDHGSGGKHMIYQ